MSIEKGNLENKKMENKVAVAERLFDEISISREEIEKRYQPRELPEGAMVTRIAPSPTGFVHLGGLYTALISERLAHQSGGVFFLRIEDTDKKREVEGSEKAIIESLEKYGIKADEGRNLSGSDFGEYGPYKQSERKDIYKTYAKWMIEHDLAYPCFCAEEELEAMSEEQKAKKIRPGYYGHWAKCRIKSEKDVSELLDGKKPFVIRYRSQGKIDKEIKFADSIRGEQSLPENDQDAVLLKSDGLPTYHFAHVIDDRLMGTNQVIRGDEWLPSTTLHIELTKSLGWDSLTYGHLAPIQKIEGESKRKLSKRKDPEANIEFYEEEGYPPEALREYLLNLANSDFEDWRRKNSGADNRKFPLTIKKLSATGGALFDLAKLQSVSKEIIAGMGVDAVYEQAVGWAKKYDMELAGVIEKDPVYAKEIFSIERKDAKGRKDIGKWSDLRKEIGYFYDEIFSVDLPAEALAQAGGEKTAVFGIDKEDAAKAVKSFLLSYNHDDSKEEWLKKIKGISSSLGYAEDTKTFKKNPEKFKGYIGNIANVFRVLLTGRTQSPDLYEIMQVLGRERVLSRLQRGI